MAKATIRTPQGYEVEIENGVSFEEIVAELQATGVLPRGAQFRQEVNDAGDVTHVATNPTAATKA